MVLEYKLNKLKNMTKHEKTNQQALKRLNEGKRIPLLRIIRLKCLECCCWNDAEVRKCTIPDCILYRFRLGKNPIKRVMSEKQKENVKKLGELSRQRRR